MEKTSLTVSIVTYKTEIGLLFKSVNDILAAVPDAHIVIADNDSGDDYLMMLTARFSDYNNVKVLPTGANKGYGYGHNFAIAHCQKAEFHLVMNADIEITPDSMHAILNRISSQSELGLIVPKILNPDGSLQALNKRNPTVLDMLLRFVGRKVSFLPFIRKRMAYYEMQDIGYNQETDITYASGCFMLFRRSHLDAIHGFDEDFFMYLEDADITRRVYNYSSTLYFPGAVITHNWSRGSHRNFRLFLVTLDSMRKYFRKWGLKVI